MSESAHLQNQFQRAVEGNAWYGPSLAEVLADVTPEMAAARPIPNAHTIWEMVVHTGVWGATVLRRIHGELLNLTDTGDWPPVTDTSAEGWERAKQRTIDEIARLRDALSGFDTARLDRPAAEGASSPAFNQVYGALQHCAYHVGQMVMLKKLL